MSETMPTDHLLERRSSPLDTVRSYLRGWNAHDGDAVAALFAPDGTYVDPTLPGPLPGPAIGGYIDALVTAFPDLRFETRSLAVEDEQVTVQWWLQGTNTGPMPGAPQPTGGTCDLPGVDVITLGPDGIREIVGYFDQKTFLEQLGLRAVVVPADEWPVRFGMSLRTELGKTAVPGALTMTWIDVRSAEEEARIQMYGQGIVERFASEPGFLGVVATFSGERGHTLAAWTSPEAAEAAVARNAAHRTGMDQVENHGLGERGFTSFWAPWRLNQQMRTCETCSRRVPIAAGADTATCGCGATATVASYI